MGGRSRRHDNLPARWSWIRELSDNRLEVYGSMSRHKLDANAHDVKKGALNYYASREYERRHGVKPDWK